MVLAKLTARRSKALPLAASRCRAEDISVGYASHDADADADAVQLYLEESFRFRVATPEAAFALSP